MKKSILTFVVFTLFGTAMVVGQTNESVKFALCNTTSGVIKYADLATCSGLIPVNKNVTVKSFTVAMFVPDASNKTGGVFVDYTNVGNKLSDATIAAIKKMAPNDTKLLIEAIIANDGTADNKYPGFEVHVK